jgi:2-methylcitrate dehydratase PrpD
MTALSTEIGAWVRGLTFDDIPSDVVHSTRLRVLDVLGLALAGAQTDFGRSVRAAAAEMFPDGPCHVFGTGEGMGVTAAPFVNAAGSQALEYDDTHVESIVHMSSPSVAAALALSQVTPVSGRELITAVALGNEVSCRVGSVSSGEFHKRGFHPTGLFAPFGIAYLTGKILGLDVDSMAVAAGITGSFAAGLLECWVDGTQSKFLHSGWAAGSGISAAYLARAGTTGPPGVLEGRFGLFASHLQDPDAPRDFGRIRDDLGTRWESRNSSFKPFPAAHVLHPYIDALMRLKRDHGIQASQVREIKCPVAGFIVPIVCEPVEEKCAPSTGDHGRVSLQYSLAEALYLGELGRGAYAIESVRNPEILELARRVRYYVDPDYPGPGRFKGAVEVTMTDGSKLEEIEEYNRGSAQNPMSDAELRAKFDDNAGGLLSEAARNNLADAIGNLENLENASDLVPLTLSTK